MDQARFSYLCCNPFDKANHSAKRKNLPSVLPWMCERIHSIQLGAKICDECRKQLGMLPIPDPTTESSECTPVTESSESVRLEQSDELTLEEITGFITCIYDDQWWVACVLQTEVNGEVKVGFLHPNGPSRSFRYPHRPDILNIPLSDILSKVDSRTVTGCVYTLTPEERRDASEKLKIAKK